MKEDEEGEKTDTETKLRGKSGKKKKKTKDRSRRGGKGEEITRYKKNRGRVTRSKPEGNFKEASRGEKVKRGRCSVKRMDAKGREGLWRNTKKRLERWLENW